MSDSVVTDGSRGAQKVRFRRLFELIAIGILAVGTVVVCVMYFGRPRVNPHFVLAPLSEPQWGSNMGYDRITSVAFDSQNRPYMLHMPEPTTRGYITTIRNGQWVRLSYAETVCGFLGLPSGGQDLSSVRLTPKRITIDDDDDIYFILYVDRLPVLVYSPDLGETFQVYRLDANMADLETRTGHNDLPNPPTLRLLKVNRPHPDPYVEYYTLSITAPVKVGEGLEIPTPVKVVDDCFGLCDHSGGDSSSVTIGNRTYFVYVRIPEEDDESLKERENPTYISTYDRDKHEVTYTEYLTHAYPNVVDLHSSPVITVDSKGYLHVLTGAHGQSFFYFRSLSPNSITNGWTEERKMSFNQTYASLVCDMNDVLYSFYRQWRPEATLSFTKKSATEHAWEVSQPLAYPPPEQTGYGIYYHKAMLDRTGAVYVVFTFFTPSYTSLRPALEARGLEPYHPYVIVVSEDGGESWKIATKEVFIKRMSSE